MNNNNNSNFCTIDPNFWTFLYKLQKINGNKKIILTIQERFNLCNYMNGKPYNKKVLKKFII
jgi:hypothetical protein